MSPPPDDNKTIGTPNRGREKPRTLTSATASTAPTVHTGSWSSLLPGDRVAGVGRRPRSSDQRLAVTGGCASRGIVGLCAPSSMLFCLLGASRQQRGEAPPGWGERRHPPLDALSLNSRRKTRLLSAVASSFYAGSSSPLRVSLTIGVLRMKLQPCVLRVTPETLLLLVMGHLSALILEILPQK